MNDRSQMTRTLDALGVGPGWSCLLVGEDIGEASVALQKRVGPSVRVLTAEMVLPDRQFDFIWVRGATEDLPRIVERLWFGGLILVEAGGIDGPALARRLVATGLSAVHAESGMAHGRRPQGTYNLW